MFEKYDGIRGFWNPQRKTFYSRLGNALPIPDDIRDQMPDDIFLDGELWYVTLDVFWLVEVPQLSCDDNRFGLRQLQGSNENIE